MGTLDELDAFLALCETTLAAHSGVVTERIAEVRQMLFRLMPALAGLPSESAGADIAKLEQWITALETENPIQGFVRNWTRPGAAQLNAARTICRRAERRLAAALESENALVPYLVWLNRLSDLLFLLAILEERHVKR
ncbi:hypothetical protein AGMMS50230_11080 [Spirochaetia bacterium]|nr:hypothetical protein AGMMS50230_11080 [Spirochaetia bacterium]